MKLHTDKLSRQDVHKALWRAFTAGRVTADIDLVVFASMGSRPRAYGYEIQLGTHDKHSGPTKSRRYKNSGTHGADALWAATYDEWGWFIAELFNADPDAIFGPYKGRDDFNRQTKDAYVIGAIVES